MPQDEFYLGVPATLQVLPAPIAPVPSDSVIYNFKGVCAGLNQPSGLCFGTLTGALDAIESAICSLQAGGGGSGGTGGTGGVTLNCGTLSPLLTAGNCIPAATGNPGFIAGYAAAGAPLRYYPYTSPVAPLPDWIPDCAGLLDKIKTCPPVSAVATSTYLGFDASGSPVKAPLPAVVIPSQFISNCADVNTKLKAIANGGCLPEDAVSATKVIAIDGLGNPIVRPIVFPSALPQFIGDCVDLRSRMGICFTLQGTTLSTVLGRDAAGTVGYYPAPSGGGGGATSSVTPLDTSSIDMSVSQVGTIFQVSGTVIVSNAAGNVLQSTAAGLFVPTPAGSNQFIADCAGLNSRLRSSANGGCLGTNAVAQTNYLAFDSSGAPTIAPLPAAPAIPTPFIGNCADLLTRLKSAANGGCLPSSVVSQTNYLAVDSSGNATIAPLPAVVIPAPFIPDCATFLTRHAPTTAGGCVTQDATAASLVYAWDATANAMRLRPLPASSTPFIANCTDFNARLISCPGVVAAAQTTYLAFDGAGNPVKAPLPAVVIPTPFIGNCVDLLTRLKSTANGGCLPTSASAQINYLAVDGAGNATIAPLPAVVIPTPFISNCTDFNTRLTSCPATSAVSVVTYLGYDGAGNPVKAPLPAVATPFVANCADFLTRLRSNASGGCLPEVLVQQPKNIAIDAGGGTVIAPSPVRNATRLLLNSPATATTTAATGGTSFFASFADTEAVKNPAGVAVSATTITIARDGYYDLSSAVLARIQSATAAPANSTITLISSIVVFRPAGGATGIYRIGQQPLMLNSIPSGVLATGVDYMFSGSVGSIWLPAGGVVQVQIQSANVAGAGAWTYNLIQPIGGGQRLSVTERTANTAAV